MSLCLLMIFSASGKAWVWHAEDFSEGTGSHEQFAIKFRSAEVADDFHKAFVDGQTETSPAAASKAADKTSSGE